MIEVLKQALEALKDVGVLTDREWQAVHKNKANELRQAIAKLESQKPVATVTSETGADITMSWWHEPALPMGTKLFTHPPQRTWVGLTNNEVYEMYSEPTSDSEMIAFAREVEAKLKQKNGYAEEKNT
jgi:hypothetical protein